MSGPSDLRSTPKVVSAWPRRACYLPAAMIYTVFRNSRRPSLYCAVPEDRPVPSFVREPTWSYECTTTPDEPLPRGFDEEAARYATNLQGFYTFRARAVLDWLRRADCSLGSLLAVPPR